MCECVCETEIEKCEKENERMRRQTGKRGATWNDK